MKARRFVFVIGMLLAGSEARAASVGMLGVEVTNQSEAQLCAEKDNVSLSFANLAVTQFRIEAAHPVYIDMLQKDSFAPDWTACDAKLSTEATKTTITPVKTTIYEDLEISVVGISYPGFWRDHAVPFKVGERVESGFQLVQIWVRASQREEEVLVVYPPDGYWRARPLPPASLGWSAYGSSFLVGPVEDWPAGDGTTRPVVDIKDMAFDPKSRTFTLHFVRGGGATIAIGRLDNERQRLDVSFDQPISGRPFAALRSMYVTEFNNDVARVMVLETGAKAWREEPVMAFTGAKSATDIWTGRLTPSRHNTSSPDTVFSAFSAGPRTPAEPAVSKAGK